MSNHDQRTCEGACCLARRRKEIVAKIANVNATHALVHEKADAWAETKIAALDKEWDRLMALDDRLSAESELQREAERVASAGMAVVRG